MVQEVPLELLQSFRKSNLAYLVSFLSLLFIHFLVGEEIAPTTIVGLILIVGGIIIGKK
jgi:drug/metabolite transporter (DMT)-like permease